ncbi:hypothetical protein [Phaffia rhodozyma]|uniref:Uncharacterized protein n=1 Tax=Phaffia rhodozyma TaxID=264483 RepID=A0A0F7STB3_PHARH|nr:hypothetical protein [Phaffia rhodozyma]
MASNDDKRPRPQQGPSTSTSAAVSASRIKRKRAPATGDDDETSSRSNKVAKDNAGGKISTLAGTAAAPAAGASTNEDVKRESKLDFRLFPPNTLKKYVLHNNLNPVIEPSPHSDLPAPLPQTLYSSTSGPGSSGAEPIEKPKVSRRRKNPLRRTAILADIQAAHEIFANQAKEHWEKTANTGIREGEVVTGFLYSCKVGDRVLKIVPHSV